MTARTEDGVGLDHVDGALDGVGDFGVVVRLGQALADQVVRRGDSRVQAFHHVQQSRRGLQSGVF